VLCARCAHQNPEDARFCSSCGAPLSGENDESTLTLSAVEAADSEDELEHYLTELPPGVGLLVVRHGPGTGSSFRLDETSTPSARHRATGSSIRAMSSGCDSSCVNSANTSSR